MSLLGTVLAGCLAPLGPTPGPDRARRPDRPTPRYGWEPGIRPGVGTPGPGQHHGPGGHHGPTGPGGWDGPGGSAWTLSGWFADVDNYDGVVDAGGRSSVGVRVGAPGNGGDLAYDPPAVRVSPGTTVHWEWTGRGGQHDVVVLRTGLSSPLRADGGYHFEHRFDDRGTYYYYCSLHRGLGMKGAVVVE